MRTLKGKFQKWYDTHHNPFTPLLAKKVKIGDNKIIELSKSRHKEFYGVSVWQKTNEICNNCKDHRPEHYRFEAVHYDLNKPFHDRDEAMQYLRRLKQAMRDYENINELVKEVEN